MKTQHDHHDRLSVRLSVIISRLLAGESLELKVLADEFGVSERTLQRDFQQRLIHLDLEHRSGSYRLIRQTGREHLPNTFAFIRNSGISGIIPAQKPQVDPVDCQQFRRIAVSYWAWGIIFSRHADCLFSETGGSYPRLPRRYIIG